MIFIAVTVYTYISLAIIVFFKQQTLSAGKSYINCNNTFHFYYFTTHDILSWFCFLYSLKKRMPVQN